MPWSPGAGGWAGGELLGKADGKDHGKIDNITYRHISVPPKGCLLEAF